MELVFYKNVDDDEISVKIKKRENEIDFEYVQFVQFIYDNPTTNIVTNYTDDINAEEKEVVENMLLDIYNLMRTDLEDTDNQ